MHAPLRNIIVTGSNKGIGYGIVQNLASKGGWNIIMAVRNLKLGQQAKNKLSNKYPQASLNLQLLDVSISSSIDSFIETISKKYGKISVLVNNAGTSVHGDTFDGNVFGPEVIQFIFKTNFYGTIELSEKILGLIEDKGKIVTIGSKAGGASFRRITDQSLKDRFRNNNISKEELLQLVHEYQAGVINGNYAQLGWPKWGYGVSKLAINLYHEPLSRYEEITKRQIQVYVCCVGQVLTDMNLKGTSTIEEGVVTPIFLIERPFQVDPNFQGKYFEECKLVKFNGDE